MMDLGLCVRPRPPNRTGRMLRTAACRKKGAQMSRRGTGAPIGIRSYEGALRRLKARNRQKRRNHYLLVSAAGIAVLAFLACKRRKNHS